MTSEVNDLNDNMVISEERERQSEDVLIMDKELRSQIRKEFLTLKRIVCIRLNKNDIAGFNTPQPYYMEMSTILSPYVHLEEIQKYFENFSQSATKKECWLELDGNAVEWDIPLGVAIDLHSKKRDDDDQPVQFILYQRNYPQNMLPLENMNQIKSRFLHSLKDVSFILFIRSDNFKMNAMPTDFDSLWASLVKGDYEEYYRIYNRVMTAKFRDSGNEAKVPLRVFVRGVEYRTSRAYSKTDSLKEAVENLFPQGFDHGKVKEKFKNVDVTISGVKQSSEVTLEYLYNLFCNPDGYLYLVINI